MIQYLFTAIFFATTVQAAVTKTVKPSPSLLDTKSIVMSTTKAALEMPMEKRLEALHAQGAGVYRNLVKIMFDESISMETRWRAVTAVGRLGGRESRPELERAIHAPEWFMRNAALVAMGSNDPEGARKWARKLLSDKALVVRAAAVETLADLRDRNSANLLFEKLYAKENFRNKQSLFIRKRIVEALAKLEPEGSEKKFIELLADKDITLHPHAIHALERITRKVPVSDDVSLAAKREHWQKWWKAKRQAKL